MGAKVYGYALEAKEQSLYSTLKMNIPSCYADIRDVDTLCAYMNKTKPRIVFHLAAQALVSVGKENPIETFSTNVMEINRHHLQSPVQIITTYLGIPEEYKKKCIKEISFTMTTTDRKEIKFQNLRFSFFFFSND